MEIVLDPNTILDYFARSPFQVARDLFFGGGWVLVVLLFLAFALHLWREYLEGKKEAETEYVIFAVDVPRENEQALKAVEQIFAHLTGAYEGKAKFLDTYWRGKYQPAFSFELVSLEGFVQFLIRAPLVYKDLVTAAIYAQYPDAEVTDVVDYIDQVPHHFPDPDYDFWGTEVVLAKEEAYPIRLHPHFEDKLVGEFKDPISAILEVLSSLGSGEQLWLQIVVTPHGDDWQEEGKKIVNELAGIEEEHEKTLRDHLFTSLLLPFQLAADIAARMIIAPGEHEEGGGEEKKESNLSNLTPGQKDILAGIEEKISKVGFETKIRIGYLARREVFSKTRRVSALLGAFAQFSTLHLNAFKAGKVKTKGGGLFPKHALARAQNHFMHAYAERSHHGSPPFVLNVEELATIWHFPLATVKAPLIMKTESKKGEPPFRLPIEESNKPRMQTYRATKPHPSGSGDHH